MTQQWYIALIPDEPEYTRIVEFTSWLRGRLPGTDLPSPPFHITIVPPFTCDEETARAALQSLESIVPAFAANTSTFDYFSTHRCWYLGVEQHRFFGNLEKIARQSLGAVQPKNYKDRIYHLTVARDPSSDESGIELSKLLKTCSPPCAKFRFKRVVLIRRKVGKDVPAEINHFIPLHPID